MRIVTARLPADLAEKLESLADRRNRPRGSIVKEAVAWFVAREEERHRLTLDALADVDAERTTDHARIERRAKRLSRR
jgi:predicted transcriptional regulator